MKNNSNPERDKKAQESLDRLVEQDLQKKFKKWNSELEQEKAQKKRRTAIIVSVGIFLLLIAILIFGLWYTTSDAARPLR